MDDNIHADDEPHVEAQRAKGLRQPRKPTPQQVHEHELAHLPYKDCCPICVQGRQLQNATNTTTRHSAHYRGSKTRTHDSTALTGLQQYSQESVERLHRHRKLLGQIRTFKAQVERNYGITLNVKHPLLPWIIRHAAWTINRYVVHSDGYTSFERRWGRNYERAIVALLCMPPQHKSLPKAELRMQICIWLGKASEAGKTTWLQKH